MNDLQQISFDYGNVAPDVAFDLHTHAAEIKVFMARTIESIVAIGQHLKAAQTLLADHNPHKGSFQAWIKTEFNWSQKQAYRFVNVYDRFGSHVNLTRLDIATSALYALAAPGTPDEARSEAIDRAEQGETITYTTAKELIAQAKTDPKVRMVVMQTAKYLRDERREEQQTHRQQQARALETSSQRSYTEFEALQRIYRIIYADPPWWYGNDQTKAMPGSTRPDDHYVAMKTPEICDLPVKRITLDNAVLFLWTTTAHLQEAFSVIEAWNFEYKTNIVWDKQAHNYGPYTSVRHEHLLIAVKGSCTPYKSGSEKSVVSLPRTAHSVKPDMFRAIIDRMYPDGNRIELFARTHVKGWDVWGNQTMLINN